MRILIVEDNRVTRLMTRRTLERELHCDDVEETENGEDALAALERSDFGLVILDLNLPVKDGLETLEAIRSSPRLASLPVVVVTCEQDAERVRQVLALGVSAYMVKPLTRAMVSERLGPLVAVAPPTAAELLRHPGVRTVLIFAAKHVGDLAAAEVAVTGSDQGMSAAEGIVAVLELEGPDGQPFLRFELTCNSVLASGLATGLLGAEFLAATDEQMLDAVVRAATVCATRVQLFLKGEGVTATLGPPEAEMVTLSPETECDDRPVLHFQSASAEQALRIRLGAAPLVSSRTPQGSLALPEMS